MIKQIGIAAALIFAFAFTQSAQAEQQFALPNKYVVKIKDRTDGDQRFLLTQNGRVLLDQSEHNFAVVDPFSAEPNLGFEGKRLPLYDFTGDGIKDLIVRTWNGGAHCCYTYDIFSLGSALKRIWHYEAGDGHLLTSKLRKKSTPYLIIEDNTFRYYGSNVFDMPVVVLRWQNGKFQVDRNRMRTGLDKNPIGTLASVKSDIANGSESTLCGYVLNLYYIGKAKEANAVIKNVLPFKSEVTTISSASEFRRKFLKQLTKSPFFNDIKAINDGVL